MRLTCLGSEVRGEASLTEEGNAEAGSPYNQAVEIVLKSRRASIWLVQPPLRIVYSRAARLIDAIERAAIVSSTQTNGDREIVARSKQLFALLR